MHTLRDIVPLPQGQAASDRRPRARRPLRVERVDVKRQVDGRVGADVRERELHDVADAVAVDVVHAEGADVVLAEDGLFGAVDVPEADVDELADGEGWGGGEPGEREEVGGGGEAIGGRAVRGRAVGGGAVGGSGGSRVDGGGEAGEEGNGHTVDVAAE